MPEKERREVDKMLRGLAPLHQRQLSVSSSNALEMFAVMEAVLQHRKLVLLLDYDGTLTPIVKDPSKALLSERVRTVLKELPKHFITGVVSGRSLGKIRDFVGVKGLFYAGSHGFDILAPSHSAYSGSLSVGMKRDLSPPPPCACGGKAGEAFPPAPPTTAAAGEKSLAGTGMGPGVTEATAEGHGRPSGSSSSSGNAHGGGDGCVGEVTAGLAALSPAASAVASGRAGGFDGVGLGAAAAAAAAEDGGGGADSSDILEEVRHQVAEEYLPVMATIRDQLIAELKCIDKSEVEDNRFSVSIHYRNCAREDVPKVREVVERVQAKHERIRMGNGKEVFELQPDIAWDKGKAVLWLLDKLVLPMALAPAGSTANGDPAAINGTGTGTGGGDDDEDEDDEYSDRFFTVFIGDDKTDENAFRALNGDMGEGRARHDGVGILVSEESKETNAAYTLRNPDEVASFLEKIAELGRERCRNSRGGSIATR
eukprot:g5147.t1